MEEKKENSEYKTAAETEIKIKNREIKRIAELEEENNKLKKEFQQYKEYYNIEKDKQQIFLMTGIRY